jgi:hypothetical protein
MMQDKPQLGVSIDFSNGPAFVSTAFTLDDAIKGVLGTGQLADFDANVDITENVLRASVRRGRNRILSNFEAGTAIVEVRDENGDWNPANTNSPYYPNLIPLRKIQIYGDYSGVRYILFTGYITSYDIQFRMGVEDVDKVVLQCVDAFRLFQNATIDQVSAAQAGDLSGTRVNDLLDLTSWPSSLRDIDAGDSTLQDDPGGTRTLLAAIQTVEQSEFGAFFMDAEGRATFYDRDTVSKYADSPITAFTDDGTALPYSQIDIAFDDTLVVNDVTVTRLNGTAQNAFNQDSIDKYYIHSASRSGILVQTDAEALEQAEMILDARKETQVRVDSMTLNLMEDVPPLVIAGLNLEIFNLVNVTKTMSGQTSITRELFVQGLQHDITRTTFTTKVLTAEPIIQAFILDSTTQGVLDVAGALSY